MILFLRFLVLTVARLAAKAFQADLGPGENHKTKSTVRRALSKPLVDFASTERQTAIADAKP